MPRALAVCLSFAVLGGLTAVAGVDAAPPRSGEIVRLERPRLGSVNRIRLCVKTQMQGGRMLCIGTPPPRKGEEIHLVDFNGPYLGSGRVQRTEPSTMRNCKSDQVRDVYFSTTLSATPNNLLGIMGVEMNEKTELKVNPGVTLPAKARKGENIWLAFNLDGAGEVDLLLTMRKCEDNRPVGTTGQGQCIAFWMRDGASWRLHNEDAIYDCG